MIDPLIPEKRGGISGLINMFTQGAGLLKAGAEGKDAWKSLKGSESSGGNSSGGLMSMLWAPKAASAGGSGAATGTGGSTAMASAAQYAPYAAPVAASAYEYGQSLDDPTYSGRSRQLGPAPQNNSMMDQASKAWDSGISTVKNNISSLALTSDSQPSKMDAIERRYTSQQDAKDKIREAKAALNSSGLSPEERRSVAQKLERADMKLGGNKRGSSSRYT